MSLSTSWPRFERDEIKAVVSILESGKVNYWTGSEGKRFEKEFSEYLGTRFSVVVANGTLALELALHAIDLKPGDEVIVPSCTFIATASAVVARGGKPVVADIEKYSQNISIETIKPLITPKTKAIICVHVGGYPCDMDPIMAYANKEGLYVIEDCAQAHGAEYKGRKAGSLGHISAFSFCQDKIMTTGGEGGLLSTNNKDFWRRAWEYKDHGKRYDKVFHYDHPPGFRWVHESFGTNWRLTEMQSAIGRLQLKKLDQWVQIRSKNEAQIRDAVKDIPCLNSPEIPDYMKHAHYKCYVFLDLSKLKQGWDRDRIMQEINAEGVPCFSGSCCEIYNENCFNVFPDVKNRVLPSAQELETISMMFLIDPTLTQESMNKTVDVLKAVGIAASQ